MDLELEQPANSLWFQGSQREYYGGIMGQKSLEVCLGDMIGMFSWDVIANHMGQLMGSSENSDWNGTRPGRLTQMLRHATRISF